MYKRNRLQKKSVVQNEYMNIHPPPLIIMSSIGPAEDRRTNVWHILLCSVHTYCCGASEPEASERSSSLIRAVGSKKQIFSVAWDCGRAQMCAQHPQIGLG